MSKISVAIADDNQRMVTAIKQLLETDDEIQVVGSENNGESTLEMIKDKEPDVVLLDIIMPRLDGIGVLEELKQNTTKSA